MFVNVGYLESQPDKRDEVIAILVRSNPEMAQAGCVIYEVGKDPDSDVRIQIVEVWHSEEAHKSSLQLPSVQSAIAEAMPLLSGVMGGVRFESAGSPIK